MPESPTATHVRRAEKCIAGRDPKYDWPIKNGPAEAVPHALLALVVEQQATNAHLAAIADSLDRIAAALAKPVVEGSAPEPKRRLWLPRPRTA